MNANKIFINYRRTDSAYAAGRLFDRLSARFGEENIFMDVEHLQPGVNFVEAINRSINECDTLIALIGPEWLYVKQNDDEDKRRLDDPTDFVRVEISTAFKKGIRVIPILLQGAKPPLRHQLPDDLQPLAQLNAIEIRFERFFADTDHLMRSIENFREEDSSNRKKNPNTNINKKQAKPIQYFIEMVQKGTISRYLKEAQAILDYILKKLGTPQMWYFGITVFMFLAMAIGSWTMIPIIFWLSIVVFALLGCLRGWPTEILMTASVFMSFFMIFFLENYIPFVSDFLHNAQDPTSNGIPLRQFWFRLIIFVILVFFGISSKVHGTPRKTEPRYKHESLQEATVSFLVGGFNGYLIFGTLWAYLYMANYPYNLGVGNVVQKSLVVISRLPPSYLLISPNIFIAVTLLFFFIIVVFV